jgi:lipoprotein NlpI
MAEAAMKQQPAYPYFYIWKALALKAGGDELGSVTTLSEAKMAIGKTDWPQPLIEFLAERIPESRLRALAATGNAKLQSERLCEIDFYIGEVAYLSGDKAAAKTAFQASAGSRVYYYLELAAAQVRLGQLNR